MKMAEARFLIQRESRMEEYMANGAQFS